MSFLLHSTVTSLKGWFPYDFFLVRYNKWEFNNCLLGWVLSTETYWRNIRSCIYQECHMGPLMQKGKWQPGPSLVRGKSLIQLCFKWPWSLLCWLLFLVSNRKTSSDCQYLTSSTHALSRLTKILKLLEEVLLQQQSVYLTRNLEFIWNYVECRGKFALPRKA